jgi:hypothetical protein
MRLPVLIRVSLVSIETLTAETAAWHERRNAQHAKIRLISQA